MSYTFKVVTIDGQDYHKSEEPAPLGYSRHDGERNSLPGHEGLWVKIYKDQADFTYRWISKGNLRVMSGFRNPKLNGAVCIPAALLMAPEDDELRAYMKEEGLPSCTRHNMREHLKKALKIIPNEGYEEEVNDV